MPDVPGLRRNDRVQLVESTIEKSVCGLAEKQGWWVRKVVWLGRRGAPDRIFAKNGRTVFIEFKRLGKEARANQARELKRMRAAGIEAHVIDSIEDGCRVLGIEYVERS